MYFFVILILEQFCAGADFVISCDIHSVNKVSCQAFFVVALCLEYSLRSAVTFAMCNVT